MTDHSLGTSVPIMGISINPDNGEIEPVGGRPSDGTEIATQGEEFNDPSSALRLYTCG